LANFPPGKGWLLAEFGGSSKQEADAKARELLEGLHRQGIKPTSRLIDNPEEEAHVWKIRESGLGATAFIPNKPDSWEGWEDSAVPPEHLGAYLRDLRKLYEKYAYSGAFYGHFGGGCVHTRINFDLVTADGLRTYRSFLEDAGDAVVRYRGSFSGEHGDGQSKAVLLPKLYGNDLVRAFGEFKAIWDPEDKMNPGKVVHPYQPTDNLRLGTDYRPAEPETHFRYPADQFTFSRAALRCVGIGECRKHGDGTMCPSYMVTKEEMHSTRGRTHLLFEMLRGEVIQGGWRDPHVKEALDLCLSCKGCRGECPVKVDVATYKAEFLSHYYQGRLHPLRHYAIGRIYWLARLASLFPRISNFFTQSCFFSSLGKKLLSIAPQRRIPPFAEQTFTQRYKRRGSAPIAKGTPVLLWVDTFTNHFHPHIAQAAVAVLEDAGYHVHIPESSLCCGRPLYDYGMLDAAQKLLREILEALRPQIRAGMPVIGLEPSCISVFRDELVNLFPHDPDAQRLSRQTHMLGEFLANEARHYAPPSLSGQVLLHGHCHHKSVLRFDSEINYLKRMGLNISVPETGCCGMAGGFGFEDDHYDVSIAAGERVLLPAVRQAAPDTWIVTSGFSCHEQILQTTGKHALHFAEILKLAIDRRPNS
jgi:Fe-S oxidoreductase